MRLTSEAYVIFGIGIAIVCYALSNVIALIFNISPRNTLSGILVYQLLGFGLMIVALNGKEKKNE